MKGRIRAKSLAAIVRPGDRALLVSQGTNSTGDDYVRLLGGSIEFGERAVDAVRREIREELGTELASPELLGVLENRFELDGHPGHEVLFVFAGTLSDDSLYERSEIPILDVPGLHAHWWTPGQSPRLVPDALGGLLGI